MSVFWIGGPEGVIVPQNEIKGTEEDRYFMPGIIHGSEDYIIQAYYWSHGEGPEHDRIGVKHLYASSIAEWAKEATSKDGIFNKAAFEEIINNRAEEFVLENDGTGDFYSVNEVWDQAMALSYSEVISWANEYLAKERSGGQKGNDKLTLESQIQSAASRVSAQSYCPEKAFSGPEF